MKKILTGPVAYFAATIVANLLIVAVANAQVPVSGVGSAPVTSVADLLAIICRIFGWMFFGLIALSLIMIIYAAFMYVTSQGDAEKVSKATKTLTYVAIAIGVALLARALPIVVGSFLGAGTTGLKSC